MLHFPIYLDNNATTPVDERVLEKMIPFFIRYFGNAASHSHVFGWQAEEAVKISREQVAGLINAEPSEIIFTSGATESDNLALKGIYEMHVAKGNHIITVKTEHKAVLDSCKHLEKLGAEVTYLDVNGEGVIDTNELEKNIKPETILIAIMCANNETGVIQPVNDISAIAKEHKILFFSDATQAVGKIPVDVNKDNIDVMAFSAHKMYGPKGIGALYVRRKNPKVRMAAQMDGGGHERDLRSGTLNVPGIAGFGMACELCKVGMKAEAQKISRLRDKLEQELLNIKGTSVNGSRLHRLPNTTNFSFENADNAAIMKKFSHQIALSSGSACTSASQSPSFVLKAMGLTDSQAFSSLRFSLGRFTTEEEIDFTVQQFQQLNA
jgi:cysteine desulfurase